MSSHQHHYAAEVTMMGLYSWYKSLFERSGWMILAMEKGHWDSLKNFCTEIDHLLDAIQEKKKNVEERDRLEDLNILQKNLRTLHRHISLYERLMK